MSRRIAVSQSNYVPWRGYFDLIDRVDEFVILDDVQYTRQDWRNRNRIKTAKGVTWLSLAIQGRFGQLIDETLVSDASWAKSHWGKIDQAYRAAEHFDAVAPGLRDAYTQAGAHEKLTDVNRVLLDFVLAELEIATPLRRSQELPTDEEPVQRLIGICQALGADTYLSGPAARAYLDEARFAEAGIAVEWMDYSGYVEYPQLHGEYEPAVSVIDLLLNTGPEAKSLFAARDSA